VISNLLRREALGGDEDVDEDGDGGPNDVGETSV